MHNLHKRILRSFLALEKISFDYDGTLTNSQGLSLIKRKITEGYDVYIITARGEGRKGPVLDLAKELGLSVRKVYFTGSNTNKILKIKQLGINKHYDNNPDVIKKVNELTSAEGKLVSYE
jgi:hypothetical protein